MTNQIDTEYYTNWFIKGWLKTMFSELPFKDELLTIYGQLVSGEHWHQIKLDFKLEFPNEKWIAGAISFYGRKVEMLLQAGATLPTLDEFTETFNLEVERKLKLIAERKERKKAREAALAASGKSGASRQGDAFKRAGAFGTRAND